MNQDRIYDCIIVGGGLAGLCLSIILSKNKTQVLLLEKKEYPFHKVCGEYVSMESWNFLKQLGLPLDSMELPKIDKLLLTTSKGFCVEEPLDLGGFGISRYKLEYELYQLAIQSGVTVLQHTTARSYEKQNNLFLVSTTSGSYKAKIICASSGKYPFGNFNSKEHQDKNWVGIKYHIQYPFPDHLTGLHHFDGGYCGISKIEDDKCCLCYLVKASQLKKYANSIADLETHELKKNPHLFDIFENAVFLFEKPITISNITFSVKKPVIDDIFYLGDSAGPIAPLSGNGMSNAMRSANILAECLLDYFHGKANLEESKKKYKSMWIKSFKSRINFCRLIQYFFCKKYLTNNFVRIVSHIKPLRLLLIQQTHGQPFSMYEYH